MDRGFIVSHDDLNQSLSSFKYIFGDRPSRRDLTIQLSSVINPKGKLKYFLIFYKFLDQIFVFFASDQKVTVTFINDIISLMRQNNSTKAIIIIRHSITSQAKDVYIFCF